MVIFMVKVRVRVMFMVKVRVRVMFMVRVRFMVKVKGMVRVRVKVKVLAAQYLNLSEADKARDCNQIFKRRQSNVQADHDE